MSLGDGKPQVLSELGDKIIPTLILIFDGLKRAYAARAAEEEEEESEEDDDDLEEGISSDEDEVDEMGPSYFERIAKMAKDKAAEQGFELTATIKVRLSVLSRGPWGRQYVQLGNSKEILASRGRKPKNVWETLLQWIWWLQDGNDSDDEDDDDDDDDSGDEMDETALEGFSTPLDDEDNPAYVDEYMVFQEVMTSKTRFSWWIKRIDMIINFLTLLQIYPT